jgi:hypothetical protein
LRSGGGWERGIALTDSRDPAVPRLFNTDPNRLRQALTLLLGAAVNHARSEVFFRLDAEEDSLHLVISSDGPALSEAALQTLPNQPRTSRIALKVGPADLRGRPFAPRAALLTCRATLSTCGATLSTWRGTDLPCGAGVPPRGPWA